MADVELAMALKQAKSKKMFFAFLPKGSDGKLIVAKAKIPAKQIAEAKKELGGGNAVTGKCTGGDGGTMVFLVAKEASAALPAVIKKVAKRDAGLSINPVFQVAGDADADEEAGDDASAGAAAPAAAPPAPPAAPAAPPAAAGQANVAGFQKLLQKLGYDPGKIDGVMGPKTHAAIKKFQQASGLPADGIMGPKTQAALAKALQGGAAAGAGAQTPPAPAPAAAPNLAPWQAARQKAISDLKALAKKVAGIKHSDAGPVLMEINTIITKLPASPKPQEIDKLEDFIRQDDGISAAEESPTHFHVLDIRKPLLEALESLKQ